MQKMPLFKLIDMSNLSPRTRDVLVVTTCLGTGLAVGYLVGQRRKLFAGSFSGDSGQELSVMKQSMAQLSEDMIKLREAYEANQLHMQEQEMLLQKSGTGKGGPLRRRQMNAPSVASSSSQSNIITTQPHTHLANGHVTTGNFPRSSSYVIDSDDSSVAYYSAAETESELEDFYDIMPSEGISGYHNEHLSPMMMKKGATNRHAFADNSSGSGDAHSGHSTMANSTSGHSDDDDDILLRGVSSSLRNLIRKIDMLMKSGRPEDFETAYEVVQECITNNSSVSSPNPDEWKHPEFLWRIAQVYVRYGMIRLRNKPDERYECFKQAKQYAIEARAGSPTNPECLKWVAIALGCCSKFADTRTKIHDGMEVKKVLDEALQYRPDDASLHHLKGRWCYEVSQLAWLERKVVQSVFGDAMSATVEEAKAHFEAVENSQPRTHRSNMLYLAKCILALDARDSQKKARDILQAALIIPRSPADEDCEEEIQKVISTLR